MTLRTKKCPGCGWEYPMSNTYTRCKFCNTRIPVGICHKCGNESDNIDVNTGLCYTCHRQEANLRSKEMRARAVEQTQKAFDDWLALIAKVPKDYKTLTDAQWLEACAFFDGCALCSNKHIDTRGFFIPFKKSGRYCDWNVIPLCEDCAKKFRTVYNPFRFMHRNLGAKFTDMAVVSEHWHNSEKRLQKIVEYLRPRLEAASNDS